MDEIYTPGSKSERLQKIISSCGIASRRGSEKLILEGRVQVNGITAELGQSALFGSDVITVDGTVLKAKEKPKGYDESGLKKLQVVINDWDKIFDNATIEVQRRMIASVVSEVKLKGKDIDIVVVFDFAKCIESVSLDKTTNL